MATFQFIYFGEDAAQHARTASFEFLVDAFHYAYEMAAETDSSCTIYCFKNVDGRITAVKVADLYLKGFYNAI